MHAEHVEHGFLDHLFAGVGVLEPKRITRNGLLEVIGDEFGASLGFVVRREVIPGGLARACILRHCFELGIVLGLDGGVADGIGFEEVLDCLNTLGDLKGGVQVGVGGVCCEGEEVGRDAMGAREGE